MAAAPVRVIAHPGAGRGSFGRRWPAVASALDGAGVAHDVRITSSAGEAAMLAASACRDGVGLIVAVGGDGTLHEIVNGALGEADRLPEETAIGLVPAGRGSDYARGLRLPTEPAAVAAAFRAALAREPGSTRTVDVGEVRYRPSALVAGRPVESAGSPTARRRFINAAGVGFSPFVAQRTARFPARLGAYLYSAAAVLTIVDWRDRRCRLGWDGERADERAIESVELLLAPYEGGGMLVAPGADPSDGRFDVLVLGAVSRAEMLTFVWRVRSGRHLDSPRVELRRASRLSIEAVDRGGPVYLQADGELLGRDPFEFRILPAALRFVAPAPEDAQPPKPV